MHITIKKQEMHNPMHLLFFMYKKSLAGAIDQFKIKC